MPKFDGTDFVVSSSELQRTNDVRRKKIESYYLYLKVLGTMAVRFEIDDCPYWLETMNRTK